MTSRKQPAKMPDPIASHSSFLVYKLHPAWKKHVGCWRVKNDRHAAWTHIVGYFGEVVVTMTTLPMQDGKLDVLIVKSSADNPLALTRFTTSWREPDAALTRINTVLHTYMSA